MTVRMTLASNKLLLQGVTTKDLDPRTARPEMAFLLSSLQYSASLRGWVAPKTLHTALLIAKLFSAEGCPIEVEMGVREWIQQTVKVPRTLHPFSICSTQLQNFLRGYQVEGGTFIQHRRCSLLADSVGLGKTVQAIAAANEPGLPVLVICPNSLKEWWRSQILEHTNATPDKVLVAGQGTYSLDTMTSPLGHALRDFDWVVVHWELLRLEGPMRKLCSLRWETIIADEAHRIKHQKTGLAKGLKRLAANRKVALTATPYTRLPSDLFGILSWLRPDVYTSYWKFYALYDQFIEGVFGRVELGPKNEGLMAWELADIMLRRELTDVLGEIPETTYTTIPIALEGAQEESYQKVKKEVLVELDDGEELVIPNAIARITRLRQVAVDPSLIGMKGKSAKYEALKDLVDASDEPVVIFTTFVTAARDIQELLTTPTRRVALYVGQHHALYAKAGVTRETELLKFVSGDAQVLVGTTAAMGEGLNLQRSRRVVFVDLPFSLVEYTQAVGRIRPGLFERAVEVITLEAKGSIDSVVRRIIERKLEGAEAVYCALQELRGGGA